MGMINVEYSLEVQARAEKAWDTLANMEAWPEWQGTPFVKLITPGPIKEGSVFVVKLHGFKWKITVTEAERPRELVWVGKTLGLQGIHEWEFQEQEGKTVAVTKESLSGWLVIPGYFMARRNVSKLDKQWLADLKPRTESP